LANSWARSRLETLGEESITGGRTASTDEEINGEGDKLTHQQRRREEEEEMMELGLLEDEVVLL
jgi:hypothetical protein